MLTSFVLAFLSGAWSERPYEDIRCAESCACAVPRDQCRPLMQCSLPPVALVSRKQGLMMPLSSHRLGGRLIEILRNVVFVT
eukprot:409489-Rhodomonas_salina.1